MMGYVSRCGGIFVSVIFHRVLRGYNKSRGRRVL